MSILRGCENLQCTLSNLFGGSRGFVLTRLRHHSTFSALGGFIPLPHNCGACAAGSVTLLAEQNLKPAIRRKFNSLYFPIISLFNNLVQYRIR